MFTRKALVVAMIPAMFALSHPAHAAPIVLYNNGPVNGHLEAYTINFGFAVADSFILGNASTVTGADFAVWNISGTTTSSIDWAIVQQPVLGGSGVGTIYGSGTAAVSSAFLSAGSGTSNGFDINTDTISFGPLNLAAGTYYFELQNAVGGGNPVYWDENNGPSVAFQNRGPLNVWQNLSNASINDATNCLPEIFCSGSETFRILGTTGATVPEPSSLALLGLGLGLLGYGARRRPRFC